MYAQHVAELACPSCRSRIEQPDERGWIESGFLQCAGCPARYAIVNGVPRMVAEAADVRDAVRVDSRTQDAFGFEWLRYPVTTYEEDLVTFLGLTGFEPSFYDRIAFSGFPTCPPHADQLAAAETHRLEGRKVLEAGCGMGKYIRVASDLGARLAVGLDASDAVERAVLVTERRQNVLIVQGDIFHPPLVGEFDFAFSIGVLHHTPAPRLAFASVASLVRAGGELAVWLYPHAGRFGPRLLEVWHEHLLRPLTSRLPHRALEKLCVALGRLTVLKTRLRHRGGLLGTGVARAMSAVAVGEHLDPGIAAFLNFDWYSPPHRSRHTAAELAEWYGDAGFVDLQALPVPVSAVARASQRRASEIPPQG